MVTIIFKILLIILVAAPVIAIAVWLYLQMLKLIRERNSIETARLAKGRIESGKEAKSRTENRKAKKRNKKQKEEHK